MPDGTFTLRSPMPVSADELYAWHSRPLAFQRLQPPWEVNDIQSTRGAFGSDGYRVEFLARCLGPIRTTWVVDFSGFKPGCQFQYQQAKGPFAGWTHTLRFVPDSPTTSFHENHVEYRLPLGAAGRLACARVVRQRVQAMFAYRHALLASDLRRHQRFADRPRLTIAITGSRGLIGSELVPFLTTGGHRVVRLVTGKGAPQCDDGTTWLNWEPAAPLPPGTLEGIDVVIHLAGDNIASGRWSDAKKRKIVESRVGPTRRLAEAIAALPSERRPKVFLSASAVGFYGTRGDELLTEDSPTGTGFFPDVCREWEAATDVARAVGVRTAHLRIGVVLSPRGGALGKQLFAFKAGAGAILGSGKQWVPWIAIGDVVGAIHHSLMTDAISGPVNHVGPNPLTNREFTKTLGHVLHRPAFFWLPRFALRAMFGEIADEALLASMRAVPKKLLDTGFTFDHSELTAALRFVLGRE